MHYGYLNIKVRCGKESFGLSAIKSCKSQVKNPANAGYVWYLLHEEYASLISQIESPQNVLDDTFESKKIDDIEVFYFLKASQAISAEMTQDALMQKSIETFTECSGAQYGVIVLVKNGEFVRVSECFAANINTSLQQAEPFKDQKTKINTYTEHVLKYVQRTKKMILINNKNRDDLYNDFIDLSETKALLCLPIIKKNEVVGIIYLENRLSDSVFTPKEVEMIKLLSVQTGISIENTNFYEEIQRENKYRKEIEAALLIAKNNADIASSSKSLFLANMSHEIRTPLNAIIGVSEILLDSVLDAKQHQLVKVAHASGENLLAIINDVLSILQIESASIKMEKITFSLIEQVKNCISIVNVRAKEKNLKLEWNIRETIADNRLGDPTRLRQILINLLSNAVKFSESGTISLSVCNRYF